MITSSLPICDETEILNFYKFVRDVCFREKYDKFKTLLDAIVAAYKQMAEQYYKDVPDELIYYSSSIEFYIDRDRFFWISLDEKLPQIPGLFGEIGNSIKIDDTSYCEIKAHVGAWDDKTLPVLNNRFYDFYKICSTLPKFVKKPVDSIDNVFEENLHFVFDLEKKCYVLMQHDYKYRYDHDEIFVCENADIVQAWVNDYCEKKFEEINRILNSQIGKEFLSDLPAAEEPVCEKVIENKEEFSATEEPESPCVQDNKSIEVEPNSEKPNANGDILLILDDLKNLCSNAESTKTNDSVQLYLDFANEEAV